MLKNSMSVVRTALFAVAVATLGSAASASAELLGEFTRFQQCPWTNTEVKKCLYMQSKGETLTLGSKKVPIEKPIRLQGGFGDPSAEFPPFSRRPTPSADPSGCTTGCFMLPSPGLLGPPAKLRLQTRWPWQVSSPNP